MTDSASADPGSGHRRVLLTLVGMSVLSHAALVGCRIAVTLGGIELGASAFTIGLLMAFFGLLPMVLSVPAGRLVDRIGTRKPMFWGLAVLAVAILAPALSWEVGSLFLASTATGLGFMGINVAIQKLGGELGGPAARATNFGLLSVGFSISSFIGPLLVGPIIDFAGFRAAFFALLLLPLGTAWWLSRVKFEERPRLAGGSRESAGEQSVFDLLRDPSLRLCDWHVGVCHRHFARVLLGRHLRDPGRGTLARAARARVAHDSRVSCRGRHHLSPLSADRLSAGHDVAVVCARNGVGGVAAHRPVASSPARAT
jgi:MFS family permease